MERSPQSQPDPTGGILTEIDDECCSAYALWGIVKQLFYAKPECAELWSDISESAAWDLHDTLRDAVILAICRLTDPPEQGKHENKSVKNRNCSLKALIVALKDTVGQQDVVHLNDRVTEIETLCYPLREHRRKRIAHLDVTVNVERTSSLPQCSASMIDNALSAVSSFLQEVQKLIGWPYMKYHPVENDGSALLMYLEAGRQLLELQEAIERKTMSVDEVCNTIRHYKL